MPRKPVVAVVGSGSETEPAISNARELGRLIAERGWVLITGGRNAGVMRAANEGAKQRSGNGCAGPNEANQSITIGILPNKDLDISSGVDVAIITDAGEARNNIIVLSADVVIACGAGDPGTASEISLAIKAGKLIVLVAVDPVARDFFMKLGGDSITSVDGPVGAMAAVEKIALFHQ